MILCVLLRKYLSFKCLNSRQYQQVRAVLPCLVPQGASAPEVLFQPQVIFHRLERWETISPRQQLPSFQLTGQLQLSDVLMGGWGTGFSAEVGSASDLFTTGWSWGLFLATENNFGVFLQFSVKYQEWQYRR